MLFDAQPIVTSDSQEAARTLYNMIHFLFMTCLEFGLGTVGTGQHSLTCIHCMTVNCN